ncbi:MAG: dienelactone hydrolase family protein [Gemmatales bacterium]
MSYKSGIALLLFMLPTMARADVITKPIDYDHQGTTLSGTLVYDDKVEGKRPGVLVVHDWMGHGPFAIDRARELAALGYVAFAVDMYGKDVKIKDGKEAAAQAGKIKGDRAFMRSRILAGLDVLKSQPQVDASKTGAMGFCFGGTTSLELARSGADISGVVSFHGGLETALPAEAGKVKGKILALHGADDPFVPPAEVANFEKEMKAAKCNWELVSYGNAVHSFTNKAAGTDNSKGAAYNEQANERSMAAMKNFWREVFGK